MVNVIAKDDEARTKVGGSMLVDKVEKSPVRSRLKDDGDCIEVVAVTAKDGEVQTNSTEVGGSNWTKSVEVVKSAVKLKLEEDCVEVVTVTAKDT